MLVLGTRFNSVDADVLTLYGDHVGIGTTSPGEILTLGSETTGASNRKAIRLNSGGYAEPAAYNTASNGDKIILYDNTTSQYDGRIGVGGRQNLWLKSSGNGANVGQIEFYTGSGPTERVRIDGTGKVGIGTTSPGEKLEVSGNIKASGTVAAGNEGLKWKVYTHTLTANEVTNKYCEISNVTIENENVRGMLCGGNADGQYHFVAFTQDYSTYRYWISADLNDGTDTITLYFGSSFGSGAVLYVIVFYV